MKTEVAIVIILVMTAFGFFGGFKYREYQLNKMRSSKAEQMGGAGLRSSSDGGDRKVGALEGGTARVTGEIIARDKGSVTVQQPDGSSKIVFISEAAEVSETVEASASALKEGSNVMIFGQENEDGSVSAQNIQLRSD